MPIIGVGRGHVADAAQRRSHASAYPRRSSSANATRRSSRARSFARWTTGAADDAYYHPLMLPQGFAQVNLVPHWLRERRAAAASATPSCPQGAALRRRPRAEDDRHRRNIEAVANYAYHLDAGKFAPFLQRHCCEKLGVRHVLADVATRESRDEHGDIRSLDTEQAGEIEGDLFVDCTGFTALLHRRDARRAVQGVQRRAVLRHARWRCRCRTRRRDAPIASHTISTAQSAGWIWDIGLPTRRGIGYVYSSRHISDDDAERELRALHRARGTRICPCARFRSARATARRSGSAIASPSASPAGFLEPLESSAIVLDRAVREAHRRADAGLPRSDGRRSPRASTRRRTTAGAASSTSSSSTTC